MESKGTGIVHCLSTPPLSACSLEGGGAQQAEGRSPSPSCLQEHVSDGLSLSGTHQSLLSPFPTSL